ncbi:MAG: HD domain-containing protein [Thermoleophilia bacterium]|nr:HD domain-containing protein [Thermoleophilia bacterium]
MSESPPASSVFTDESTPARRVPFITFAVVLACVLAGATVYLAGSIGLTSPLLIASVLLAILFGARTQVLLPGGVSVDGMYIPLVATAVLAPALAPVLALVGAAAGPAAPRGVRLLNGSYHVASASVAAIAAQQAIGPYGVVGATAIAGLVFILVNCSLFAAYECLVWGDSLRNLAAPLAGSVVATGVFAVPLISLVTWGHVQVGSMVVPFVLFPVAVASYFHSLYHRKVQLTSELADKAQVLARTNLQFAAAMVKALDQRDAYTAGHSAAVAVYTRDIAREMGFDDETVRLAHLAGLLHDIGKIGVPGRVLNKTAPLDDEEYEIMKSHAAMGAEILGEVDLYSDIAILVRYHHERIDGTGYPERLEGEQIPAISRMISVADTYSAMTTDRPYRDGMPTEKAMSILSECRGTQLDTDFTNALLRILIVADAAYQRGKQTDFEVEVAKHQALSQVEAEAVRLDAPSPAGPQRPAAPKVPVIAAETPTGEVIEIPLEREAA